MRRAPASERMTLGVADLVVSGHVDGIALRFGPGPEVGLFQPCIRTILDARSTAAMALLELDRVLAKAPSREGH